MGKRKETVYGAGINDYVGYISTHGVPLKAYKIWVRVLERCHDTKYKTKNPSYNDVTICDEWIKFSNFKDWFVKNYKEGYEIDKDILVQGNKVYSPDTCCFVPRRINTLLLNKQRTNTSGVIGVAKDRNGSYSASVNMSGIRKHVGYYKTIEEAAAAYVRAKSEYATKVVNEYYNNGLITEQVRDAIIKRDWSR